MSTNKGFLLQSFFTLLARFAGVGLNFGLSILIARLLSLANYGDMRMLLTTLTGVALISRLGVEQLLLKEVASVNEQQIAYGTQFLSRSYIVVLISSLCFMLLWVALSEPFAQLLFDKISTSTLMIASVSILFYNLIFINATYLKAIRKTVLSSLTQNSLSAVSFLILIALFLETFPSNPFHFNLYSISWVMAGLLSLLMVLPWLDKQATPQKDIPTLRDIVKRSLPLAPVSILAFMMLWSDTLMVGALLSSDKVALYSTAAQISFLSLVVLNALEATIYPRLLSIYRNQPEKLRRFFWQATFLVVVFLLGVTLIMSLLAPFLLGIFGTEFKQALNALIILLFAQWLRASSLTFSFMFIIRDQVKYLNITLAVALLINIIANYFFIKYYGYIGATFATLAANAFLTLVIVLLFYRHQLLTDTKTTYND